MNEEELIEYIKTHTSDDVEQAIEMEMQLLLEELRYREWEGNIILVWENAHKLM